ncbi:MAG: metallophosphoesterase [Candidatus Muproteobacteria bacterium RIFCSPHIGHO2_01_60_12]|nr:MAG: metallophosphoesterase [Candidatus Muproteobacteria bacterium RIFCSPHIGHO2_01_60_12]
MDQTNYDRLAKRLGRVHLRQRLGLESEYEAQVFHRGTHFFHLENWYFAHAVIRGCLGLIGLHGRGRRNALKIRIVRNEVPLTALPAAFDGYTILHLSDLHLDMSEDFVHALIERVRAVDYDLCVLTGDYRYRTRGPYKPALAGFTRLRPHLKEPVYAVLGNHDTIRMVPGMEDMGIQVLLNESVRLERQGAAIHLAGIDDAHYYRVDNIHKAAHDIPHEAVSILLSHTPETYRNAAHADFKLMLCGHTHGGQICLPGGIPLITDADCPRAFARGPWRYHDLVGYTSVGAGSSIVDVRLNCLPEITLHRLRRAGTR